MHSSAKVGLPFISKMGQTMARRRIWSPRPSGIINSSTNDLDRVISEAKAVVGTSPSLIGSKTFVSEEMNSVKEHLRRLVGSNHPFFDIAKQLVISSQNGFIQSRGLVVLLAAKALMSQASGEMSELTTPQRTIAEMTELIYAAYLIHKCVIDVPDPSPQVVETPETKNLRFGNKMSILSGDLLLSSVLKALGEMRNNKVVELMANAISSYTEGQFLIASESDLPETNASSDYWKQRNYLITASLQSNSCQSALAVAKFDDGVQSRAFQFGKNFGLALQAYNEARFFLQSCWKSNEPFDLMTAPILLYIEGTGKSLDEFRIVENGKTTMAYDKLFQAIKNGPGMDGTRQLITDQCSKSFKSMDTSGQSDAVNCLRNWVNVMKEL